MTTTTATLSLGNDSVEIPLLDESGTPLVSSDLGKPEVNLPRAGGSLFPRSLDNWSGLQNITLRGRFTDSNAYQDARTLVDIVESDWGSDELTLDVDLPEYDDNILVAPSAGSDQAVSIQYNPGRVNDVLVDASFSRVSRVQGTGDRTPTTPTATGSGPVELRAVDTTVSFSTDLAITRSAGRPNDVVRRDPTSDFPYYINKQKTITETITLEFLLHETPVSDLEAIGEIFRATLGRDPVTLDFQGLYGLGEFAVIPTGSAPFRQARRAGYEGMSVVPTFEFRRVYSE